MNIGFFIPSVGRGGVGLSLAKLLAALSSTGLNLTVLYGDAPDEWLDSVSESSKLVKLRKKPLLPFLDRIVDQRASTSLSLVHDLVEYLRRHELDVLVGYQSGAVGLFARWRAGVDVPVVVRESTIPTFAYAAGNPLARLIKGRIKSYSFRKANAVVAVCRGASDDLIRNFGIPSEIVHVIFNPAVPTDIDSLKKEHIAHAWFDDSSDVPIVVSVGRLAHEKDVPTTLRAFAELSQVRDVRLVIVGEGPLLEDLQALAIELGIKERVWFTGHQSNPYKFMAQSNVFVLTSIYEGIANVIAEALAIGVPIVATDCPTGPAEVLLDGRAGVLVPVGDHAAVADAIQRFLDDPSLITLFTQGIADSIKRFQPDMAANAYVNLVQKLTS